MRDVVRLRDELVSIPGARLEFNPDIPPRIPSRYLHVDSAEQVPVYGRQPVVALGAPPTRSLQNVEMDTIYERIDQQVAGIHTNQNTAIGIDALAWYASFHNLKPLWGIFIPESSLWYVAERWFDTWRVAKQKKLAIAFRILYEHELFHYAADLNVAQWELMINQACWAPYRTELRSRKEYCQLEEQLANAYMLRMLAPSVTELAYAALVTAVRRQPPGYCDAEERIEDVPFADGLSELCKRHVGIAGLRTGVNLASLNLPLERFFGVLSSFEGADCPVHIIRDADNIGRSPIDVSLFDRIPAIRESRDFMKQLGRVPHEVYKRWQKKKIMLSRFLPGVPEFERMKGIAPATYSIRLGTNFRAHLRPEPSYELWTAIGIGTHKSMGHG